MAGYFFRLLICARFRIEVGGLQKLCWENDCCGCVDTANHGHLVHHRGLFGQVFAEEDARELGVNHAERAAIFNRSIGLRIPHINVAWPSRHPK